MEMAYQYIDNPFTLTIPFDSLVQNGMSFWRALDDFWNLGSFHKSQARETSFQRHVIISQRNGYFFLSTSAFLLFFYSIMIYESQSIF